MQYLSDEWIEAADASLSGAWASQAADEDPTTPDDGRGVLTGTTTIQYTVSGTPQGKVTYCLSFDETEAGITKGKADSGADATMELDYETAVAIATGASSPQVAFMQGNLKLGGDVTLLIDGAAQLQGVADALSSIEGVEY